MNHIIPASVMKKEPEKPVDISQSDWDDSEIPEITAEDFARVVPFKDAHPEAYASWIKKRGRKS